MKLYHIEVVEDDFGTDIHALITVDDESVALEKIEAFLSNEYELESPKLLFSPTIGVYHCSLLRFYITVKSIVIEENVVTSIYEGLDLI